MPWKRFSFHKYVYAFSWILYWYLCHHPLLNRYEPGQFYEVIPKVIHSYPCQSDNPKKRNSHCSLWYGISISCLIQNHHDYIEHHIKNQQGVRILTSYLYLNDVEAGGGTRFTDLNITVMPKRGRALFWPSVLNDSPHEKDRRTNHQGKYRTHCLYHSLSFIVSYWSFSLFLLQLYLLKLELSLEQMAGIINSISRYVIIIDVFPEYAVLNKSNFSLLI